MQIIQQQIEDFTASNLVDEFLGWDENTEYILEADTLTSASVAKYGNYYYRNVLASNVGNIPSEHPTKWLRYDVSNKSAMLDVRSQTFSTSDTGDIVVEFARGLIDTLTIGYFTATSITIEHLDALGNVLPTYTQTFNYSVNEDVYDYYSYMYAPYSISVLRNLKVTIPFIGTTIRVTFGAYLGSASCGYLIGGEAYTIGDTQYGVNFSFNSYAVKEFDSFGVLSVKKRSVQDIIDFETSIYSVDLIRLKSRIKEIYNDYVVFILDESDGGYYDNLITLGMVQDVSTVLSNDTLSTISWSVIEAV